jgi:hypothetical protein
MGHHLTAIILKGDYNQPLAETFDLLGITLTDGLTMFPIDHYFSACWQAKLQTTGELDLNGVDCVIFPRERALSELMTKISTAENPVYAIILTDYFGGIGEQYANVYLKDRLADKNIKKINHALAYMGVKAKDDLDEFDTVGLSRHRSNPDYLEKYVELAYALWL